MTYLDIWDFLLRPFGLTVWSNPNYLLGVQFVRLPKATE